MMSTSVSDIPLNLLCDPETRAPLALVQDALFNPQSGVRYPFKDGIPQFAQQVVGLNRKYQGMYDKLALGYDLAEQLYKWISRKPDYRLEYIRELEINPGARVLEVSVGTGANLRYLPPDIEFVGLDLSQGMLRRCRRNLRKWHRSAQLFQGEAERLPFRDAIFDCVFHVGGINFFNDKATAIAEMIRVARPRTKIVIVDETEEVVSGEYQKNPLTRRYFKHQEGMAYSPQDLVPSEMLEARSRKFADGKLYCLTFLKPANSAGSGAGT